MFIAVTVTITKKKGDDSVKREFSIRRMKGVPKMW